MEPAWRQQGRGRGGGGGGRGQQQSERSQQQPPQKSRGRGVGGGGEGGKRKAEEHAEQGVSVQSQSKFEDIRKSNQAAAQRLVQSQYSSSSDDDDDDDEDDDEEEQVDKKEGKRGKILQSTFTTYTHTTGGDITGLQRTSQFVSDLFQSGATSCLICISSIRRTQPVWSCEGCYCVFHISCIQQWARDSAFLVSSVTDEDFGQKKHPWPCPKCRTEYAPSSTPNRYMCYCGKVQDPPPDPWLLPHSCGSVCERDLQPVCGHTCLLLCHPGPCPPCPKMVSVSCLCGRAKPLPRRCSNKGWACQQKCGKLLPCKQHSCTQPCHSGVCKECPRVSVQRCVCGKEQAERECASPRWHCQQICGVSLPCGHHVCERACHDGPCGECPRSGRRVCPCGKSEYSLPCTEDVGTCGDTCGRPLACGLHRCSMRCHRGQCETCRQDVERACRCGRCKRVTSCHKEYVCDFKCPKSRGCQRHQCRRKCCPGNCPPCDLLCGRTLGCRNHKCPSGCHPGSCYPCPETVEVRCACGQTAVTVPCGRERHTRPPRCKQLCRAPPSCHHPSREPHRCHDDACPPCRQCCSKPLPLCEHTCPASCHDNVMVKTQQVQVSGPWEKPAGPSFVQKNLPCPPCVVPIATSCFGEHEVSPVPCHKRGPFSCKRPCGRPLACGNHSCRRECHTVAMGNKEQSRKQCEVCEEVCAKPRPAGCHHPCPLPCHRGDCPPCPRQTRQRCHCCLSHVYVDCTKWTEADKQTRIILTSCKNQCPKELQCGHRCKEACHPGSCEVKCQHRMKMRCPCKRIKKDYLCYQQCVVECDDNCRAQLKKASQLKEEEEKAVQEEEQKRLQAELEAFEKRQKGRRGKKRGRREEVEEAESGWWRGHGLLMLLPLAVGGAMLAAGLYYLVY